MILKNFSPEMLLLSNLTATKLQRNFNQISATGLNNMFCYIDDMNSIKQERNSGDNKCPYRKNTDDSLVKGGEYNE
jgi:hypothetical protein